MAVMKVTTDITVSVIGQSVILVIIYITASLIGQSVILVIIYIETFKTNVIDL